MLTHYVGEACYWRWTWGFAPRCFSCWNSCFRFIRGCIRRAETRTRRVFTLSRDRWQTAVEGRARRARRATPDTIANVTCPLRPPPPRGAYWLQQSSRAAAAAAASTNGPSHPTVRFQGLSSTPEEVGESSPGLNGTLKKTTFGQTPSYSCNGGRATPNGCIKSELHHNTYQGPQKVFEQCPKQTNTLDQLPKQRNNYTLDQLGKQQQQQHHQQQQQQQQQQQHQQQHQQQGPVIHYKPSLMSANTLVGFIPGKIVEDGCVVISRDVTVWSLQHAAIFCCSGMDAYCIYIVWTLS